MLSTYDYQHDLNAGPDPIEPTPGPWEASATGPDAYVVMSNGNKVYIGDTIYHPENIANAHLMAAAPELHRVLSECVTAMHEANRKAVAGVMVGNTLTSAIEKAKAAIASAEVHP